MKISNSDYENIDVYPILPILNDLELDYEFLLITDTGRDKSILDARIPFQNFLKRTKLHDYSKQLQGPKHKVLLESYILTTKEVKKTETSLYRPVTKKGDPRLWARGLKKYCEGGDTLLFLSNTKNLYVINLSNEESFNSIKSKGKIYDYLSKISNPQDSVVKELLGKLQKIHNQGFIASIVEGDTGVGTTLEHYLNIKPNVYTGPDYKGIELKCKRFRSNTRTTLFSTVPDWKSSNITEKELIETYGYNEKDKKGKMRLNLNCTLKAQIPNPQGLYLEVDEDKDILINKYKKPNTHNEGKYVLQWDFEVLRNRLLEKHHQTFFVEAKTKEKDNKEYFQYNKVTYTKNPEISLLPYLINEQIITVDYVMHKYPEKNSVRDHGFLFKIKPINIPLLFGNPLVFNLDK